MIAWGDVPTWLGVVAAVIGGIAALRQLSLQRAQLRDQQNVIAERLLFDRQDAYAQLLVGLQEWDAELSSVLAHRQAGESAGLDTTELARKYEAVRNMLGTVMVVGTATVIDQAKRAIAERVEVAETEGLDLGVRPTAEEATAHLYAGWPRLRQSRSSVLEAIRHELQAPQG